MKFYKNDYEDYDGKIIDDKLSAVYNYCSYDYGYHYFITFYKDGKCHNNKNACYVDDEGVKLFFLNAKEFGNQDNFTKETWRRFIKLQAFL
jgi:hypothetical protein